MGSTLAARLAGNRIARPATQQQEEGTRPREHSGQPVECRRANCRAASNRSAACRHLSVPGMVTMYPTSHDSCAWIATHLDAVGIMH